MKARWMPAVGLMSLALVIGSACSDGGDGKGSDPTPTTQELLNEQKTMASSQVSAQMRLNAVKANLTTMQTQCDGGDAKMCADLDRVLGQVCAEPGMESACAEFGGAPSGVPGSTAESTVPDLTAADSAAN